MKKLKTERAFKRIKNKYLLTLFGAIIGILALPIFIIDRVLMSPVFWIPLPTLKQFYKDEMMIVLSIFRLVIIGIFVGLVFLIRAIF